MFVCVRRTLTRSGWVDAGRLVDDDDPMLSQVPPGVFVRVIEDGSPIEEATANPGERRRTRR